MKKRIEILGITFLYDKKNVRILNPREIKNKWEMLVVLIEFRIRTDYKSRRTIKSWIKEWKAHNRYFRYIWR